MPEYCQRCGKEITDKYEACYYDWDEKEVVFCCEQCVEEFCEKNNLFADDEEATLESKTEWEKRWNPILKDNCDFNGEWEEFQKQMENPTERNDYLIKVPVREIHNWYFRVWATNEKEALEKFKKGLCKTFLFADRIRSDCTGEPVIIDKEKVK